MKITLKELNCLRKTFTDLFPGTIILFTGSAVLNILGAIDCDSKDIDIILIPDHPDINVDNLQESIKKEFPEGADPGSCPSFFSVSAKYFGHTVEIQVREKPEDYLTLSYEGSNINISKIDEMFKYKFNFNEDKAYTHVGDISEHLIKQNTRQLILDDDNINAKVKL